MSFLPSSAEPMTVPSCSANSWGVFRWKKWSNLTTAHIFQRGWFNHHLPHSIHVWYIYLHLPYKLTKCWCLYIPYMDAMGTIVEGNSRDSHWSGNCSHPYLSRIPTPIMACAWVPYGSRLVGPAYQRWLGDGIAHGVFAALLAQKNMGNLRGISKTSRKWGLDFLAVSCND